MSLSLPPWSCEFYFGSLNRKSPIFTLASFTLGPRVDTVERKEEKQVFRNAETKKLRPKPEEMDMKKRVSLELRHRSPTEVSNPICSLVYAVQTWPAGGGGDGEHMAGCLQFLKSAKMNNYCSTLSSELMSSLGYSLRGSVYILNSLQEVIGFIGSKQPSCAAVYRPVFSFMFTLLYHLGQNPVHVVKFSSINDVR